MNITEPFHAHCDDCADVQTFQLQPRVLQNHLWATVRYEVGNDSISGLYGLTVTTVHWPWLLAVLLSVFYDMIFRYFCVFSKAAYWPGVLFHY